MCSFPLVLIVLNVQSHRGRPLDRCVILVHFQLQKKTRDGCLMWGRAAASQCNRPGMTLTVDIVCMEFAYSP